MTYDEALAYFARRAKGRNYKVLFNGRCCITVTEGVVEFRYRADEKPFATLVKGNVLTVLVAPRYLGRRMLFSEIAGFGVASSCTSTYGSYACSIRFLSHVAKVPFNVPLTARLALDTGKDVVLYSVPDVKKVVNKAAAKPAYEYVKRIMKVYDVLLRVGSFAEGSRNMRWADRSKLDNVTALLMEDEHMADLAEAAYRQAVSRTSTSSMVWDDGTRGYVSSPSAEVRVAKQVRANAAKYLREKFKKQTNCFDSVTITN